MDSQEEKDQAIEDAAFEEGFTGEVAQQPTENTAGEAEIIKPEDPVTETQAVEEDKPLTRAEILALAEQASNAAATKVHDKAFGKIGELQQRIESIKTAGARISPQAREKLSKEFPELAEMLFDGADDIVQDVQPKGRVDDLRETVAKKIAETEQKFEKKLVLRDHKDFDQVIADPMFREWAATLPPQTQVELASTWDADFISPKLSEFKEYRDKKLSTQQEKDKKREELNKRLIGAIQPKGTPQSNASLPSHLTDEDAAMEQAFKTG